MPNNDFEERIVIAEQNLRRIRQEANQSSFSPELQNTAIEELSIALEELQVSVEEIHEQNQELLNTRQELEWEQLRYQDLFEFAPDAYLVTDQQGIIQKVNGAAVDLFKFSSDYLQGKQLDQFVAEVDQENFRRQWPTLMKGKGDREESQLSSINSNLIRDWEIQFQPHSNKSFPALISVSGCYDPSKSWELYWLIRDLSDRQEAERQIQEQAALLNAATDAIFVQDLNHCILFWNRGAEHLYGWQQQEAVGKNSSELLVKKVSPQLEQARILVLEKGEWQGELHLFTKSNQEIIIESHWTLVCNETGQPKSIFAVDRDITEKKSLEAQLLHAQRLESIGTLASGIAHDLNNILTPILAGSQLLQIKLPDSDQKTRQLLQIMATHAQRGADLIKQVLSFSRGVGGRRTALSIKSLIKDIEQVVQSTFPKSISIQTQIASNLKIVQGDATQLHQVLMNLCVNSRDAMPQGGILTIDAENVIFDENKVRMYIAARTGTYVAITVEDTGKGISQEILERIFDPFFTTKDVGKGTGLGLSTSLGIIKSHGGFIDVSSQIGKGTKFTFFIPTTAGKVAQQKQKQELPRGNGQLILVVDDEPAICETTRCWLETYNYRVLTAKEGTEAIAFYFHHQQEISAIIMDMIMPSLDGATTIRILNKVNPQIKIIAVSGLVSDPQLPIDSGSSVKAFLAKPYTSEELLTTVAEVIASS